MNNPTLPKAMVALALAFCLLAGGAAAARLYVGIQAHQVESDRLTQESIETGEIAGRDAAIWTISGVDLRLTAVKSASMDIRSARLWSGLRANAGIAIYEIQELQLILEFGEVGSDPWM